VNPVNSVNSEQTKQEQQELEETHVCRKCLEKENVCFKEARREGNTEYEKKL